MTVQGQGKGTQSLLTLNLRTKTFYNSFIALLEPSSFFRIFKTFKMMYGDPAFVNTPLRLDGVFDQLLCMHCEIIKKGVFPQTSG